MATGSRLARTQRVCVRLICALMCLILAFLCMVSLLGTTRMNLDNDWRENVVYVFDSLPFNLLLLAACALLFRLLRPYIGRVPPRYLAAGMCLFTLAVGITWILSAQSSPGEDSWIVTNAASAFAKGDYSRLQTQEHYFTHFPYQLGYVLYCELFIRLFGLQGNLLPLQGLNLLCLCVIQLALVWLAAALFRDRLVTNLTALLAALFLPATLFVTLLYGNLPGLAFAMCALAAVVRYLQQGGKRYAVATAVCIALASLLKPNNMILLVAIVILLGLQLLREHRLFHGAAIVLCIGLTLLFSQLVVRQYEWRSGAAIGDGVPQTCRVAMGLNDSYIAPGWYDSQFAYGMYDRNHHDAAATSKEALAAIDERLSVFSRDPDYANAFFFKKIVSQWNEPTYQSIWVSQARPHYGQPNALAAAVYDGGLGRGLMAYMDGYQLLLFAAALLGVGKMTQQARLLPALLPLTVLGGFLFHLIFEAKSQYVLPYVMLLIPIAAYGLGTAALLDPDRLPVTTPDTPRDGQETITEEDDPVDGTLCMVGPHT